MHIIQLRQARRGPGRCGAQVGVAPSMANAQNLVTNGGFESLITGWTS